MGQGADALLTTFTSLPPWVQTAVLTGWGLNKLTGGALGNIAGILTKSALVRCAAQRRPTLVLAAYVAGGAGAAGAAGQSQPCKLRRTAGKVLGAAAGVAITFLEACQLGTGHQAFLL